LTPLAEEAPLSLTPLAEEASLSLSPKTGERSLSLATLYDKAFIPETLLIGETPLSLAFLI